SVSDRPRPRQLVHFAQEPAGMAVEKLARFTERPALRHGEDRRPGRTLQPKRIVPRVRMPAQRDGNESRIGRDLELVVWSLRTKEGHSGRTCLARISRYFHDADDGDQ